jgi:fatty-acyl-CoA synthase/long-chain acyl-CoA synthetase
MIKYGAHRIHPQVIEEQILGWSGVAEVAVVGIHDSIWGEVPVAFIVPATPSDPPDSDGILEHCRKRLPRYKMVREVRVVSALPKTASGKIKRSVLRGDPHDRALSLQADERCLQ